MQKQVPSVEDFIGHFDDLIELYKRRIADLRQISSRSHGNARVYREIKIGQAEELEQVVVEIRRIISWFRTKREHISTGRREISGQLSLFPK